MKSLRQLLITTLFAALACTALHAQTVDLLANIPFDFHTGDKLLPAGKYLIHADGSVVFLRTADGNPASIFLTFGATAFNGVRKSGLDFDRYGDEYFLTTIWNSFNQNGRAVPKTARQKELAARGNVPVRSTIAVESSR